MTKPLIYPPFAPAPVKGAGLPETTRVTIPSGLDWVVRQRVAYLLTDLPSDSDPTNGRVDDLKRLDKVLRQNGRSDIYQVVFWGYEVRALLAFLMEQERTYAHWWVDYVPVRAKRTICADLRGLITEVRAQCRAVDVYAHRPSMIVVAKPQSRPQFVG